MAAYHRSLLIWAAGFSGAFWLLPGRSVDDAWKNHPALAEPDGYSHRGDKMVAAVIDDPRIQAELSRRFQKTKRMRLVQRDGEWTDEGAGDFEKRQEYLLRLLDYYWFSKERLVGMTRTEVQGIFGPLGTDPKRAEIYGGRDCFCIWFENGRVSGAFYAMGY